MPNTERLSISLPADLVAEMRAVVAHGDYASLNDVVRAALRDWRLRRKIEVLEIEELRLLLEQEIENGAGLEGDTVFARLRARLGDAGKG